MRLISLEGRNVGLLRGPFRFEFDDALTVITGPIGCGKSTILMMVKSSLTNNIPGSASSWVTFGGLAPDDCSYFEVCWAIGKKVVRIAKCLAHESVFKSMGLVRLRIEHEDGSVEDINATKEAQDRVQALVQLPSGVIDGHLVVDQESITAPVTAPPAKFKEIIHALTKADEMEAVRGRLRDLLSSVVVPDVADRLEEARTHLVIQEGRLAAAREELADTIRLLAEADKQGSLRELETLTLVRDNNARRAQLAARETVLLAEIAGIEQAIVRNRNVVAEVQEKLDATAKRAEQLKNLTADLEEKTKQKAKRDSMVEKATSLSFSLDQLNESEELKPESPRPTDEDMAELRNVLDQALLTAVSLKQRKENALRGVCSTCGADMTMSDKDMAALEDSLAEAGLFSAQAGDALSSATATRSAWEAYDRSIADTARRRENLVSNLETVISALEQIPEVSMPSDADIAEARELLHSRATMQMTLDSASKFMTTSGATLAGKNAELGMIRDAMAQVPPAKFSQKRYDELTAHLSRIDELEAARIGKQTEVTIMTRECDDASAKVKALEKRMQQVEPIQRFRDVVSRASEFLSKDALPKLLSSQYMRTLNDRLDYYMKVVNAGFEAYIDENLEFMARKPDGLVHRAARLSGGQKQQASVCYLLAVSDVFAGSLGVLALDEPTGAMQDSNTQDMAEAFSQLARIGQQTGRQFIVITHSEVLASYGRHIDLGSRSDILQEVES